MDASRLSRWTLIAAGGLALIAVGVRFRPHAAPAPAPAAQRAQPDVAQVIAGLEAKLKANPNDAEGWRMLGWAFFQTEKFAEAATAYRRAAQLDPSRADYWASLGEALVLAGPGDITADAQTAFRTALQHDPKDPRSRYFLAVAKDMAGDHAGAIGGWFAILNDSPGDAPWYAPVRQAIERVASGNHIDVTARLAALKPVPAPPADPGAALAAGPIPGPTPEQMRAATALPPGQQEAMVTGMVEGLAAKLRADPRNPDGWIMLMRSYAQLGRDRDARAALASAKAANPTDSARLTSAAAELGIR